MPVSIDQTVRLEVSEGDVKGKVPSVLNRTIQEARDILNGSGFFYIEEEYVDSEKAEDTVISQSVEPKEEVSLDTTITLEISNGIIHKMPYVVNRNINDAMDIFKQEGLSYINMDYVYSDKPEGTVLSQSVEAGKPVREDETITLEISNGPKPTEPPTQPATKPTVPPEKETEVK